MTVVPVLDSELPCVGIVNIRPQRSQQNSNEGGLLTTPMLNFNYVTRGRRFAWYGVRAVENSLDRGWNSSGDISSRRSCCGLHRGLSLQALEISRDGYRSENAASFLV